MRVFDEKKLKIIFLENAGFLAYKLNISLPGRKNAVEFSVKNGNFGQK